MTSLTGIRKVNMDGSSDPHFRYKMPAVLANHNNKGKMKKTVLVNIKEVSESVGRPAEYLITYLGQKLSASTTVEKDVNLSFVTGHHDIKVMQEHILNFIQDAVMCHMCQNPETSCHTEGTKKRKVLFLQCKGCGERSDLDSGDRFVKYMITHHAGDALYGHAVCTANATDGAVTTSTDGDKKECPQCQHKTAKSVCGKCGCEITAGKLSGEAVEAEQRSDHKKKRECPTCHYKTSKPLCIKCGTPMQEILSKVAGYDVPQDLLGSDAAIEDSQGEVQLDDFNACAKEEGLAQSAPLERLGAVVEVIASKVGKMFDIGTTKLQPLKVAQEAKVSIATWSGLMEELSDAVEDDGAVADMVIGKVQTGIASALSPETLEANGECVVVGLLLAIREVNCVANGLLEGCQRLEDKGAAMNKFIDFLVDEAAGDESEDDEEGEGNCEQQSIR